MAQWEIRETLDPVTNSFLTRTDRDAPQIENREIGYEDRFVAFLDILGFRAKVLGIENNASLFDQIRALQEHIEKLLTSYLVPLIQDFVQPSTRLTLFSDSIVISAPASNNFSFPYVVIATLELHRHLGTLGTFVRGGIARGPLYHQNSVLFGAGLIQAYDMERKHARTPRVIFAPGLGTRWLEITSTGVLSGYRELVTQDADGFFRLDMFHETSMEKDDRRIADWFAQVRDHLVKQLAERVPLDVWSKLVWLAGRFNESKARETHRLERIEIPEYPADA